MRPTRRGFTLIEITVALVMFAVVALALTRMLIASQRITTAQSTRAALQTSLRTGSVMLPSELRMLNQGDSTDIAAVSDTSITYRAMRGYYTLCAAITGPTAIKVISAQPSAFAFEYRPPAAGDSLFIFFEDDTLKLSDDRWAPAAIAAVAKSTCTFGGSSYSAYALTLGGSGIATSAFALVDFGVGAPSRSYELTTLALYTSGGTKWLGMCAGPIGCTLQPVLGPLADTDGVTITRYDDVGSVISGNAFSDRNSLRTLRIRFIGVAEQGISKGGDVRVVILDTLTTTVTLRSAKHP